MESYGGSGIRGDKEQMKNVKLCDCTLRAGGYWKFRQDIIKDIICDLVRSNVDMIDLGILRTVDYNKDFTIYDSLDRLNAFVKKSDRIQYAVTVTFSDAACIKKMPDAKDSPVDTIRVLFEKEKTSECMQYIRKIIERNYKVFLCPLAINRFKSDEFVQLLEYVNEADASGIYLMDNWGCCDAREVVQYATLADRVLAPDKTIGYYAQNNLGQTMDTLAELLKCACNRMLLADASIGGIGKYAGDMQIENAMCYLNQYEQVSRYQPAFIVNAYDKYIKHIYNQKKQREDMMYHLLAVHKINPQYGDYYFYKRGVKLAELQRVIEWFPDDNYGKFSRKRADRYLNRCRKEYWQKRLAVIIPTANRAKAIDYYLSIVAAMYHNRKIDLIIYDSSSDDSTRAVVRKYNKKGYGEIKYVRYHGAYDGVSIDRKCLTAYEKFGTVYEYIWPARDGIIINLEFVIDDIDSILARNPQMIVVNADFRDVKGIGNRFYDDAAKLFKDQCMQMSVLGATIMNGKVLLDIMRIVPLDKIRNYGLWQPIAFFDYFAKNPVHVESYVGSLFLPNFHAVPSSFWTKRILWQWGERWYTMIDRLPSLYDKYKEDVLKDEMFDFHPYQIKFLIMCRGYNGINWRELKKYRRYLPYVCDKPLWIFYAICLIPKWLIRVTVSRPQKLTGRITRYIYRNILQLYRNLQLKSDMEKDNG